MLFGATGSKQRPTPHVLPKIQINQRSNKSFSHSLLFFFLWITTTRKKVFDSNFYSFFRKVIAWRSQFIAKNANGARLSRREKKEKNHLPFLSLYIWLLIVFSILLFIFSPGYPFVLGLSFGGSKKKYPAWRSDPNPAYCRKFIKPNLHTVDIHTDYYYMWLILWRVKWLQ